MTAPRRPTRSFWRHKLPLWLLVGGLAVIVLQLLRGQPVPLEVTYHFDEAGDGLRSATLIYHAADDGAELRRITYRFAGRPAGPRRHHVVLPRGEYALRIELLYGPQGPPPELAAAAGRLPDGTAVVRIRRPLLVEGEGRADLFILGRAE